MRAIFEAVICILAIYGFFCLIINIANIIGDTIDSKNIKSKNIIFVKDKQNSIEGIVRKALSVNLFTEKLPYTQVIVVDMGSNDETLNILKKLERNYEELTVLSYNDRDKLLTYIE